jgi:hypothetical protein
VLRDLQSGLSASILYGDDTIASRVIAGALTAEQRLAIYRHNVFSTLRGALADLYPLVQRIVGRARFNELADTFIRDQPSTSGDLNDYGSAWPQYLTTDPRTQDVPYLADVARVEWAWHRAFHAANIALLELSCLAQVREARHDDIKFHLHPSVTLIPSSYPLFQIHAINQPDYAGDFCVDWRHQDNIIVHRDDETVTLRALDAGVSAFLHALAREETLALAADRAFAADGAFDLQQTLMRAVRSSIISGASLDGAALTGHA